MVLNGRVRIRTFDRIEERHGAILIRQTGDRICGAGRAAAMTTAKDNVHWFTLETSSARTLDVIIDGLDRGEPKYLIQPVDPLRGRARSDGTIVAPILSFADSMRRYTARV
jgi:hypothetical protein